MSKLNIILTTGDINISFGIQNLWRGTHFGGTDFMQVQKFGQNFSGTLSTSDTNFVIYKSLYIGTEIFCSDIAIAIYKLWWSKSSEGVQFFKVDRIFL